jgi:hypothetical protein
MHTPIDNSKDESRDYTTGELRRHHQFYIPSGDIVFRVCSGSLRYVLTEQCRGQVENAIFKMHSHFLTTQSDVFHGMLSAPRGEASRDGTDENPLVLMGDAVGGWELLLYSIYRS